MPELHPQFLTDQDGKRLSVVLSLDEYEALVAYLADLEDRDERPLEEATA